MSSLNVFNTFLASTVNNNLTSSKSALSITGFVNVRSALNNAASRLFGQTLFPLGNVFGWNLGSNRIGFYGRGVNRAVSYSWPIILNQNVFTAITIRAVGDSYIYFNGEIVATVTDLGVTRPDLNGIRIGVDQPLSADVLLDDLAVYDGFLTNIDVPRLRDKIINPSQASVPVLSWWPLNGNAGSNPTTIDFAMHDQVGGNHFSIITNNTNAVYSGLDLSFVPSVTCGETIVTKNRMIKFGFGTNPALGGDIVDKKVVEVNTDPIFHVDGQLVSSIRSWSNEKHLTNWVMYQLYKPGDPSFRLTPDSIVTYIAQSDWVKTTAGYAGASSGTFDNYVDRYESGYFGFPPFDPTVNKPKMKMGVGCSGSVYGTQNMLKNLIKRTNWSGAATLTPDGFPLTFGAGNLITGSRIYDIEGNQNGIDNKSLPPPLGIYTILADETNPSHPILGTVDSGSNENGSIDSFSMVGGILENGIEKNKKWQFNINNTFVNIRNIKPQFKLRPPAGAVIGAPQTLTNIRIFPPGNSVVYDPEIDIDDNMAYMLSSGTNYVDCIRYLIGHDGAYNFVLPSNIRARNDFSYGDGPAKQIAIKEVRRYDPINQSQKIYLSAPYRRSVPTVTPDNINYKFMWTPADYGLDYDWAFLNNVDPIKGVVIEFVCSSAHGLQSGHYVNFGNGFNVSVANARGTGTTLVNGEAYIFVTSDTSFIVYGYGSSLIADTKAGWVNGTQTINKTCTWTPFSNGAGFNMPPEGLGTPSRWSNGKIGIWFNINHAADNDGAREFLQRVHDSIPRGTKVRVQFSNEPFIPNPQYGWLHQLSCLEGFVGPDPYALCVAERMVEIHDMADEIWSDDPGAHIRLFQPWTVSPGNTLNVFKYLVEHNKKIHEISLAPYVDMDKSSDFTRAAAQIIANDPDSIAYGKYPILDIEQYMDMWRHTCRYRTDWRDTIKSHRDAVVSSGYIRDGYVMPDIVVYEGNVSQLINPGISKTKKILRAQVSHDANYHPSFYDGQLAYDQMLQCPGPIVDINGNPTIGFDLFIITTLLSGRTFGTDAVTVDGMDGGSVELWDTYEYQSQLRGYGLNNKMSSPSLGGNGLNNAYRNEAVAAQVLADWLVSGKKKHYFRNRSHMFSSRIFRRKG